jgi:hypothetical protein
MKVTLIKKYKLVNKTLPEGTTFEVINEKGQKLIDKGIAVKFGEKPSLKAKVKKKLENVEENNDKNEEK